MASTIVGLFDDVADANEAKKQLTRIGINESDIRVSAGQAGAAATASTQEHHRSLWQEFKDLFTDESDRGYADYYAEGARRGSVVVTVTSQDGLAEQAADILRRQGAVDIEGRAAEWRDSGWSGYGSEAQASTPATAGAAKPATPAVATASAATAAQQNIAVPVVEEQLEVGKRRVQSGGVRVVRRVIEKPVTENVELREEHVDVQRRPVRRDITGQDLNEAFADKTIEVTETAEVPVSAKTARVVEEVVVNKGVEQRTEQVRDTVRRSDVQVERLPGQETTERGKSQDFSSQDIGTTSRKVTEQP